MRHIIITLAAAVAAFTGFGLGLSRAQSLPPSPPPQNNVVGQCLPPERLVKVIHAPGLTNLLPEFHRRKHRAIIREPGGAVGIRVESTNAIPGTLLSSTNLATWQVVGPLDGSIYTNSQPVVFFRVCNP